MSNCIPRFIFENNNFRFMESEMELNDIVQEMHVVATTPNLYPVLIELNAVESLLQLLSHENTGLKYIVIFKNFIHG